MSLQGPPKGPYETPTLCSQTSGNPRGAFQGSFKTPSQEPPKIVVGVLFTVDGCSDSPKT